CMLPDRAKRPSVTRAEAPFQLAQQARVGRHAARGDHERAPHRELVELGLEVFAQRARAPVDLARIGVGKRPRIGAVLHAARGYRRAMCGCTLSTLFRISVGTKEFEMTSAPARVNVMDYSGKQFLLDLDRKERGEFYALLDEAPWEGPTASGHW